MVAKPDKRAGSASKAVGTERCGVQVLWLSPSLREFREYRNAARGRYTRVG